MAEDKNGIIVKLLSGFYYVLCDGEITRCRARGVFRKDGITPLVGDRVTFLKGSGSSDGTVTGILERKNSLDRPAAANIDRIVIVSSHSVPSPNTAVIDRITAAASRENIDCIIVFNKCDMGDMSEYKRIYTSAGFECHVVSAETGEGIDALKNSLLHGISVFTGNTGVGKSSILNCLIPDISVETGEVSEKLGRGRHTTRHIELFPFYGGAFIGDTPGFSSFTDADGFDDETLVYDFPDIAVFSDGCKFVSCTHTGEKDCKVCEAVASGKIELTRYESYRTLYDEVKKIKSWEKHKKRG